LAVTLGPQDFAIGVSAPDDAGTGRMQFPDRIIPSRARSAGPSWTGSPKVRRDMPSGGNLAGSSGVVILASSTRHGRVISRT
jgi:hypothetical protein